MFYCDRVFFMERKVKRDFPTIKGQTTEFVKERKAKGLKIAKEFGFGIADNPMVIPQIIAQDQAQQLSKLSRIMLIFLQRTNEKAHLKAKKINDT